MGKLRIIDIIESRRPNDIDDIDLLVITGIKVSTLRDAVRLSESARDKGIITIGIPLHDVSDMGEFRNYFDAVIISKSATERITKAISVIVNELGYVKEILSNAGTVYFGEGSARSCSDATKKAAEMLGDAKDAECFLASITTSETFPDVDFDEMNNVSRILKDTCTEDAHVFWVKITEDIDDDVRASVFAVMNDKRYKCWQDFFMYESDQVITEMIENGLDENIRIILGSEKSFFAACLIYGTPELVRKFISKGHNPKELEVDGVFPDHILESCLYIDICARNSDMLQILLEAGISLSDNCLGAMPRDISSKTIQALIDYGADPDSRGRGGMTRLMTSAKQCSFEAVKILVEAGADVNARDERGRTAIMMIQYGCLAKNAHEILKYLIANGADINAHDDSSSTAMLKAAGAIYCFPDIVKTFIEAGAYVNEEIDGSTVLDLMFSSANWTPQKERLIFLREVLPMMLKAGAIVKLPDFHTERKRTRKYEDECIALRLLVEAIRGYDVETVKGIIERCSLDCLTSRSDDISDKLLIASKISFRINDFPEAESDPSERNTEIKRKLDKGAEILKLLNEAGIKWPLKSPSGHELTYAHYYKSDSFWREESHTNEPELSLCYSPEALKKFIASASPGKSCLTSALKIITENFEDYYNAGTMAVILLKEGADHHVLFETWAGSYMAYRDKRLMIDDVWAVKFISDLLLFSKRHELVSGKRVKGRNFVRWNEKFGGPLSYHLLSHLWELIETRTDYRNSWVNYSNIMMLLSACWGSVEDIEDTISYGGNVNYSTWLGYTPLMYASFFNTGEAVKCLIDKGADVHARNMHNQSVIELAVSSDYLARENYDAVSVLCEAGVDLSFGSSLIEAAIKSLNVDAVKSLLLHGVRPDYSEVDELPETKACKKCGHITDIRADYCHSCGRVFPVSERY